MRGTTSMSRKAAGTLTAILAAALMTCAPAAHAATVAAPLEPASATAADRPEQDSGVPLAPLGLLIAGFTIVGVSRVRARGQAPVASRSMRPLIRSRRITHRLPRRSPGRALPRAVIRRDDRGVPSYPCESTGTSSFPSTAAGSTMSPVPDETSLDLSRGHRLARMTGRDPGAGHRPRRRWSCCSTSRSSSRSGRPPTSSRTWSPTGTPAPGVLGFVFAIGATCWAWIKLLLVRVRLRHRRLALPRHDAGPDDRRRRLRARAPAAVRLARGRGSVDNGVLVAGYVVMRVAMIGQWLRVAGAGPDPPPHRAHLRGPRGDRAGRVDRAGRRAPVRARRSSPARRCCSRSRSRCAGARRAPVVGHAVAPAAHRRALRPARDHRAR